ncbi:MAG: YqgE/AlgH family protein [Geminicoccaceae bacterium]
MGMTEWDGADLTGQLLVAMPTVSEEPFARTVIYLCAHSEDGAMGLVVNRVMDQLTFPNLIDQLGLDAGTRGDDTPIHFGGPVESSRGFVLHSADYIQDSTLVINQEIALTATVEVLKAIAGGHGPRRRVLALGYAGWAPGQLDSEIQANGWLMAPADGDLVFGPDNDNKWERALRKIGIDPAVFHSEAGHA